MGTGVIDAAGDSNCEMPMLIKVGSLRWKRCKCRKSLYIQECDKIVREPAKSLSQEQTQRAAKGTADKRDPMKRKQRELDAQNMKVAQDHAQCVACEFTEAEALKEWIA
jgi:hypothetical protein